MTATINETDCVGGILSVWLVNEGRMHYITPTRNKFGIKEWELPLADILRYDICTKYKTYRYWEIAQRK